MGMTRIYPPVKLRIRDVMFYNLLGKRSLVCLVCPKAILRNYDSRFASASRLKTPLATASFGLKPESFTAVAFLLYLQLAVNREPCYRQGTRIASYCVSLSFLCVLFKI